MKRYFCVSISTIFWLLMVVGFSDNWLFDRGQESNSHAGFMIHAFFAFSWFSLLVVQSALVSSNRLTWHKQIGFAGVIAYVGFFISTIWLYGVKLVAGPPGALTIMNMTLFGYASLLFIDAIRVRQTNPNRHKTNIMVAAFMLMEPAIGRSVGHLFDEGFEPIWLLTYLIFFGLFIAYFRKINWQLGIGLTIWILGTANIVANMA